MTGYANLAESETERAYPRVGEPLCHLRVGPVMWIVVADRKVRVATTIGDSLMLRRRWRTYPRKHDQLSPYRTNWTSGCRFEGATTRFSCVVDPARGHDHRRVDVGCRVRRDGPVAAAGGGTVGNTVAHAARDSQRQSLEQRQHGRRHAIHDRGTAGAATAAQDHGGAFRPEQAGQR